MSRMTPAALAAAARGDFHNAMIAATPGGIEAQEAAEQQKAVAAQRMPKEGTSPDQKRLRVGNCFDREVWESLGFTFGDDYDDIFVNAAFPAGWKLKPTDHSMWNDLLDAKGRKRAAMFYKGAFYDRSAHIHLARRFNVNGYHGCEDRKATSHAVVVEDCGTVIESFGLVPSEYSDGNYAARKALEEKAKAWLTERYPEWENPLAYWD
jgi:hypothetical protein